MTPEEFDVVTDFDENYLYELVNGVLVVREFPGADVAGPNEELGCRLQHYRDEHPAHSCFDATLPEQYVPVKNGRRIADRLIWIGLGRLPNRRRDIATIAVEFVSAGKRSFKRDYFEKKREYLRAGVKEYWIIDRFRRTLTVVRKKNGQVVDTVVREKGTYRTALLPGFELPLAPLLALADRWAEQGEE
jgi:Uma2 family endonuclease